MKNPSRLFIVVDDDPQNITLSKMALHRSFGEVEILDFVIPETALAYIQKEFAGKQRDVKAVLFLDINMPSITGWEFLDIFQSFTEEIKNQFNIYMLSSSIDPGDIERARLNPLVVDFIEKPLNKMTLSQLGFQ